MTEVNRQWTLAARPEGLVKRSDFRLAEAAVPAARDGEIVVRTLYLSLAPVMRQYMIDGANLETPLQFGDVIPGRGVGQVIESRHPDYAVGEVVHGKMGWQTHVRSDARPDKLMFKFRATDLPASLALGVLGLTGLSAYVGMLEIGAPQPGETVLVSGTAGGVGAIAGQLARIAGARVVGVAGGERKARLLTGPLRFAAAIDYKALDGSVAAFEAAIAGAAPEGIDVFFDNVGGPMLDAALARLNHYARVALCGRISQYASGEDYALTNWTAFSRARSKMQGFFVYDHASKLEATEARMAAWVRSGELVAVEDVLDGFEHMPEGLMRLYDGRSLGKQLVKVAEPLDLAGR